MISDSNATLTKLNDNSLKDEARSTFDKSNPIYNKEKGTSTIRRNSKNSKNSKNSRKSLKKVNSNQISSIKSKQNSVTNIEKINSDLNNLNGQIEVDVHVGD